MAIAPSPTAAAIRLAEPLRTSPTAKMPGRLVSRAELPVSWSVRTKPRASRSPSQPLQGLTPIKTNSARVGRTLRSPVRPSATATASSVSSPSSSPHLGDEHDPHVRDPLELVDEVPRHVLAQVVL